MDVPGLTAIYDPQHDETQLITTGEEEQQQPPAVTPQGDVRAPKQNLNVVPLPELGGVVINGLNKEDVELVKEIIKFLQEQAKLTGIKLQIYPLQKADATSVATTLTQVFTRIQQTPSGRSINQPNAGQVGGFNALIQQQIQQSSVLMIPLPRFNAIMIGAPANKIPDIIAEINKLDVAVTNKAVPFALNKASAALVATQVQQWYAQRYGNEANGVRVTYDASSNTLFVQAAPAEMAEIKSLLDWIDTNVPAATNDVRIVRLNNARADELANTLLQALSQAVSPTLTGSTGIVQVPTTQAGGNLAGGGLPGGGGFPGGGQQFGGQQPFGGQQTQFGGQQFGGQQFGQQRQGGGFPGTTIGPGGAGAAGAAQGVAGGTTTNTKNVSLRLFTQGKTVQAGAFEDVHITSEPRSNSLVLAAPPKTMELILALIKELDVVAAARAEINVFTLKKADASQISALLQSLFTGATTAGGGAPFGGAGAGATTTQRPILTTGTSTEGASLIELRVTVDARTNSLIAAGSRNDLDVIRALIARLEDEQSAPERSSYVFKMRNAAAADVQTAIQTFYTNSLTPLSDAGLLSGYQQFLREVVVVAEPVTNSVLVSATQKYFEEIRRMIDVLDNEPPQVMIEVLIAQVNLDNNEEFGIEIGAQSPVLFNRSVFPGGGTISQTIAGVGLPQRAIPGFSFNNPGAGLPTNTIVDQNILGVQGLGSFGVGRTQGFVFSASSESLSILLRALKTQGRSEVMSYPALMTTDNQAARLNAGQDVPYLADVINNGLGQTTQNIARRTVGVILSVTPRISPDGHVLMRVAPEVSSQAGTVTLATGANTILGTVFNVQSVDTTVLAEDGETIVIGGLITKEDKRNETKVPVLGDIPVLGALFRYRTREQHRQELLVILTPHILRNSSDRERMMSEHGGKMHWNLCDVAKLHGHGLESLLPQKSGAACATPDLSAAQRVLTAPLGPADASPAPQPLPNPTPAKPAPAAPAGPGEQSKATKSTSPVMPVLAPAEGSADSTEGKEARSWSIQRPQ